MIPSTGLSKSPGSGDEPDGVTNTEKTVNLTLMGKYKIYKGKSTFHVVPTIYGYWVTRIKDGDLMKFITYKDKWTKISFWWPYPLGKPLHNCTESTLKQIKDI